MSIETVRDTPDRSCYTAPMACWLKGARNNFDAQHSASRLMAADPTEQEPCRGSLFWNSSDRNF